MNTTHAGSQKRDPLLTQLLILTAVAAAYVGAVVGFFLGVTS